MFDTLIGQEHVKKTLGSMMKTGRIPHAFLLAGPNGSGKSETAFELARMLVCENGPESGCTSCRSCLRATRLEHPDLHVLFPYRARPTGSESLDKWMEGLQEHRRLLATEPYAPIVYENARQIVVELVNEVYERLLESSFEGGRRVCIIVAADRLNKKTGNTLLKILEEPPDGVHFILTSERLSSVLPTITSRSSILRFRRLRNDEIESYLERRGVTDPEKRRSVAQTAEGSLKAAKAFAFSDSSENFKRACGIFLRAADGVEGSIIDESLPFLRSQNNLEAEELLYGFIRLSRTVLETKMGFDHDLGELSGTVKKLSRSTDIVSLHRMAAGFERSLEMLSRNVNLAMVMSTVQYEIYDAFGKGRTKS